MVDMVQVQLVERTDCCEVGESGVKSTFSVGEGGVSRGQRQRQRRVREVWAWALA